MCCGTLGFSQYIYLGFVALLCQVSCINKGITVTMVKRMCECEKNAKRNNILQDKAFATQLEISHMLLCEGQMVWTVAQGSLVSRWVAPMLCAITSFSLYLP